MDNLWQPSANLSMLQARARVYQSIREFFTSRQFLEVDVPVIGTAGTTDLYIQSFTAVPSAHSSVPHYLQTSPEFFMKRLLANGSGPIFSLGKAFRQEEAGRFHNPEFTLLEWYQPGFDDHQLMTQMSQLLSQFFDMPMHKTSYAQAFIDHCQLDPHLASVAQLKKVAEKYLKSDIGKSLDDEIEKNLWLDLLFTHLIQPALTDGIHFIFDYPASQAALAKVMPATNGQLVARRFEVFINGLELANGYWELTDADEQRARFESDNRLRRAAGLPEVNIDSRLVAALNAGLPECAGVALGVDRLLMLLTGADHINATLAFDWSRS